MRTDRPDLAAASVGAAVLGLYLAWLAGLGTWLAIPMVLVLLVVLVLAMAHETWRGRWVGVVLILALLAIALGTPSGDWDARSIWLFHAKRIYFDRSLAAVLDGYSYWSHNDYPVLVPAVAASLAALVGHWNEVFPKSAGLVVMAPALFVLMRRLGSVPTQLAFASLLVACGAKLLANGYMDALVALYLAASLVMILELVQAAPVDASAPAGTSWLQAVAAVVILAPLTLLKNEGLFALACAIGAVAVILLARRQRPQLWPLAVIGVSLLLVAQWKWWVGSHGVVEELASSDLRGQLLARLPNLHNSTSIARALFLNWQFLLPAGLFAFAGWKHWRDASWQAALLASLAYTAILFAVYLSTPNDLAWHLFTSASRTVLPIELLLGFAAIRTWSPSLLTPNHHGMLPR